MKMKLEKIKVRIEKTINRHNFKPEQHQIGQLIDALHAHGGKKHLLIADMLETWIAKSTYRSRSILIEPTLESFYNEVPSSDD